MSKSILLERFNPSSLRKVPMVFGPCNQPTSPRQLALLTMFLPLAIQGCSGTPSSQSASLPGTGTPAEDSRAVRSESSDGSIVTLSVNAANDAGVTTAEAEMRGLEASVNVTGEVLANANTQIHVTTPVIGRVVKILVKIGDHVKLGQDLMIIRSTDIEQAESDLLQAEQQVRSDLKQNLVQIDCDTANAAAQLKLDEKVYARLRRLAEDKIVAEADLQAAETNYSKDKIMLNSLGQKRKAVVDLSAEKMRLVTEPLKTKLRLLGVTDDKIVEVMKSQTVNPIDTVDATGEGIVVERLINVGELIDPSKPLFTIGNFQTVWLKADVFEKDISKVNVGQPIELQVDSFPGRTFKGRLDYVANQVDADTRTLAVRAEVMNPDQLLKPKMFAQMRIIVADQKVLVVPTAAVQDTSTSKVVYVPRSNNSFEERKVKIGAQTSNYTEILQGLKPGEQVVTQGSITLRATAVRMHAT